MKRTYPSVICLVVALLVTMNTTELTAQTSSDRVAIKEWITTNKSNVTLISSKEYQAMSPAVKALIDSDPKSLVYHLEVTKEDIQKFANKNQNVALSPFQSKEEIASAKQANQEPVHLSHADRAQVKTWLDGPGQSVKVIAQADYMNMAPSHRTAIGTSNVLIYSGNELTWKDIQLFEGQN